MMLSVYHALATPESGPNAPCETLPQRESITAETRTLDLETTVSRLFAPGTHWQPSVHIHHDMTWHFEFDSLHFRPAAVWLHERWWDPDHVQSAALACTASQVFHVFHVTAHKNGQSPSLRHTLGLLETLHTQKHSMMQHHECASITSKK